MYQKEFILRIIEQLGKLIAGILGLIKKGQFEPAKEQLEKLYSDMLKEDASFFKTIPEDHLIHKLLQQRKYSSAHLEILAELFNTEAVLELEQGNKDTSHEFSRKSLILFEFIDKEYKTYSQERLTKMEAIRERIKNMS